MPNLDIEEKKADIQSHLKPADLGESGGLYSIQRQVDKHAAPEKKHSLELERLLGLAGRLQAGAPA